LAYDITKVCTILAHITPDARAARVLASDAERTRALCSVWNGPVSFGRDGLGGRSAGLFPLASPFLFAMRGAILAVRLQERLSVIAKRERGEKAIGARWPRNAGYLVKG